MAKTIDPLKLNRTINLRTIGEDTDVSDSATLSFLKIRPIKGTGGTVDISIDVSGCNFRCAHCWVSNASLGANFNDPSIQKKVNALPKAFRNKANDASDVAEYLHARLLKTATEHKGSGVSLSGGEPLPYRGGIKTLAGYFQEQPQPFYINLETTGFLIARDESYLDVFDGLQDTLRFYVSIKSMNPERFEQFTGVEAQYLDDAFIVLERILKRGFLATPGGVVLNTFETVDNLDNRNNDIARLHQRLSHIHPDLPQALAFHKIDFANVQNREELNKRMINRGLEHTRTATAPKIQKALISYFENAGTPIMMANNNDKVKAGDYNQSEVLLRRITQDLS